jgi:hypothetical protein
MSGLGYNKRIAVRQSVSKRSSGLGSVSKRRGAFIGLPERGRHLGQVRIRGALWRYRTWRRRFSRRVTTAGTVGPCPGPSPFQGCRLVERREHTFVSVKEYWRKAREGTGPSPTRKVEPEQNLSCPEMPALCVSDAGVRRRCSSSIRRIEGDRGTTPQRAQPPATQKYSTCSSSSSDRLRYREARQHSQCL